MLRHWFWGPYSPLGLIVALLTLIADQGNKVWMIYVYDIGTKQPVRLTPFFDLILVWNKGISYGMLQQDDPMGRLALVAFAVVVSLALIFWLARVTTALTAISIGLIVGGAAGNAIDRAIYGAVADFFSLHAFGFQWYIFNIADVAIVAGVIGLLYDSLFGGHKKAGNPSKM
ncbi:MAG: signal peptidase II [Methyloceanibacter sp.]|uniref:signal peptidase II n=1 Tax=Methyloceanibacter sp. TaxID=1965321 RepID=UPI001DBE7900|nr:signal peptidase II [Methyloceanibacter sp.]MCB1442101.1 signal peptidase II [Methyloceanibacter sp.]MCC0058847.1 signal peptidase II [Hyphomicrobiaceae bacterium]